jgi:hypothetical protein
MSKHTPGPWIIRSRSGFDYGTTVYDVPEVCTNIGNQQDACLIAAAPDLKERLQRAIDALDRLTDLIDGTGFSYSAEFSSALDEIDLGRAAINKAEGKV